MRLCVLCGAIVLLATQVCGWPECRFQGQARLNFEITRPSGSELQPEVIRVGEAGESELVDIGIHCYPMVGPPNHDNVLHCYDPLHDRNGTYDYEVVIASQTYRGIAVLSGDEDACLPVETTVTITVE